MLHKLEARAERAYRKEKELGVEERVVRPTATLAGILSIPLTTSGEFELNDQETAKLRRLVYGINKDAIRRYRTLRDGMILLVWRIK